MRPTRPEQNATIIQEAQPTFNVYCLCQYCRKYQVLIIFSTTTIYYELLKILYFTVVIHCLTQGRPRFGIRKILTHKPVDLIHKTTCIYSRTYTFFVGTAQISYVG